MNSILTASHTPTSRTPTSHAPVSHTHAPRTPAPHTPVSRTRPPAPGGAALPAFIAAGAALFVALASTTAAQQVRAGDVTDTLTAIIPISAASAARAAGESPAAAAAIAAAARAGAGAGAGTTGGADDETVVLSPFVVTASARDTGYYVENTLAGTRLNTNISDLASSITVVTRQQMEDLATNSMDDIFLYEANTEGTGNYTDFSISSAVAIDNTSTRPESANRVRGIGSVDRSRNFYPSTNRLPFDSYNTESVEINRGPNSLLFGLGSPAGIVNQSTAIASTTRRYTQVKTQYGSHGDFRAQLRANLPLVRNRLGLFVGGLYSERGFVRQPAHDINRRGYVALSAAVAPGTTIRANYENWRNRNRRPNYVTPVDLVTPWVLTGMPSYRPDTREVYYGGDSPVLKSGGTWNTTDGLAQLSAHPVLYNDRGDTYLWMQTQLSGLTAPRDAEITASSSSELAKNNGRYPLFVYPGVNSRSVYDWENINLFSINSGKARADVYNIEIDQKILDNLYLQLGWYREDLDQRDSSYFRGGAIYVDVNRTLLNGDPNPGFGRPYIRVTSPTDNDYVHHNETLRASLAYTLDYRHDTGWTKWLGLHRFMGLWSRQDLDSRNLIYQPIVTSSHSWTNDENKMSNNGIASQNSVVQHYYVGDKFDNRVTYAPGDAMLPAGGALTYPLTWGEKDPVTGAVTWTTEDVTVTPEIHKNSLRARQTVESLSAAWQGYFLQDRLIATLGLRRDTIRSRNSKELADTPPADTGVYNPAQLDDFAPLEQSSGNTSTAGIVAKPLRWLSFYYNHSDNFTTAPTRYDLFGNILPLPTGTGKDYGVRLSLLNNRLVASLNFFQASSDNARGTEADIHVGRTARVDSIFFKYWANWVVDQHLPGVPRTDPAHVAAVAAIMQLPDGREPHAESLLVGTSTVDAKGLEFQLIINPVRNWNTKLTIARQEAYYTNVAPQYDAWAPARLAIWQNARDDLTGSEFWTCGLDSGKDPQLGPNTPPGNWIQRSIITNIKLAKANEGKQTKNQREWRANLFSTYRFTTGPFRDFTLGGALRWQSKSIIGYLGADPEWDGVEGAYVVNNLDPDRPVYDDPVTQFDFWIGYAFKMPWVSKKLRASLQLNLRDAFEGGGLQPIAVNPDGTPSVYRIVDSRQWALSLTLDF
jgi:outer membrane receptor protein involved in Fe transport